MYRMVLQAILFTILAIGFIVTKSDGLRSAAKTGDFSKLTSDSSVTSSIATLSNLSDATAGAYEGAGARAPWYETYDPRKLWRGRSKTIRLNPKSVTVADELKGNDDDLDAQIAAQGLDANVVSVVKLP